MTPRCSRGQGPAPEKAESRHGTHIILMRMTPRPEPLSVLSRSACLTPISLQWWLSASLFQAYFHLLSLSHVVLLFAVGKLRCQGKRYHLVEFVESCLGAGGLSSLSLVGYSYTFTQNQWVDHLSDVPAFILEVGTLFCISWGC